MSTTSSCASDNLTESERGSIAFVPLDDRQGACAHRGGLPALSLAVWKKSDRERKHVFCLLNLDDMRV